MVMYAKETSTPLDDLFDKPVNMIFYVVTYLVMRNKEQEKMIEQMRKQQGLK